ncbi:hypothetical protein GCM10023321_14390 [Pseudonocardia eucalypti]|uniref:Esterase n=1 Tax=Pseudonocardia eucalypti TaxID=648755 RepID=A0ABP9PSC9_9PSEU|nr:S-formylglutathione hydrolase FrmB [Pseudonocardia eucalypti]
MRGISRIAIIVGVVAAVLTTGLVSFAAAGEPSRPDVSALPGPFRDWGVRLARHGDDPKVLDLVFNSPLLHRRITNRVNLPAGYATDGKRWPVLYYLHGTVVPALDNPALRPVLNNDLLAKEIGPGGGAVQTDIFEFGSQADRAHFLVVSPDTDPGESICQTCAWIDGRPNGLPGAHPLTARELPMDSYLHKELYPLVEALFHARADRAGRAVAGFSMGGVAAYLQGMLHPDRYALAASVSGLLDVTDDPVLRPAWEGIGYWRDQGYGTGATNSPDWHGRNPRDLVSNLVGIDLPVLSSSGDGCLPPTSLLAPDCRRYPAATNPGAGGGERLIAYQYDKHARTLRDRGIAETRVQYPGVHGGNNHRVYAQDIVPLANTAFDRGVKTPERFNYRTVITDFSVWGYNFEVHRAHPEFLEVTSARADGRALTLHGSGVVQMLTPDNFHPDQTYHVIATSTDGTSSQRSVRANHDGRLPIRVDLGRATPLDQTTDQIPRAAPLPSERPIHLEVH